jgi:Zn-dependent metalloprotease
MHLRNGYWTSLKALLCLAAVALLAVTVAPTVLAKAPTSQTPAKAQVSDVDLRVLPPLATRDDPESGIVRRIYSPAHRPLSGPAEYVARQYLEENYQMFGMKMDLNDLEVYQIRTSPSGEHVRFRQTYAGIPIYRADIVVNVTKDNRISSVYNGYHTKVSAPVAAAITDDQAYDIAWDAVGVKSKLYGPSTSELVIFPHEGRYYLAHKITLATGDPMGDWWTFVDATNGQVITIEDHMCYSVDGTGQVFDPDPMTTLNDDTLTDQSDSDAAIPSEAYLTRTLEVLNDPVGGLYYLDGPYIELADFEDPYITPPAVSDPDSFFWTRSPDEFENVICYYAVTNYQLYLQSLGFTDANNRVTETDAHGLSGADNSHYIPSTHQMAFGDGGVDDAEDIDVILHEYNHAMNYDINPSWGGGHMGAMGEGNGDYCAGSYSWSINPNFHPYWVFTWDGHNEFWAGRVVMDSSMHYPEDANWDIYTSGTLWCSGLTDLLWTLGDRDVVEALYIDHQFALGSSATMADAANEIIQSDINMFGGAHLQTIVEVFDWWGFVDADEFIPQIAHDPLLDTEDTIGPYEVVATVTSVQPLDPSSMKVHYGTTGAFTDSLLLSATGTPNEYSASIPGPLNDVDVQYYIVVKDSAGGTATHPAGAPASYHTFYVGADTEPPVVDHTPLRDQAIIRWPATVRAEITDNIGIQSAVVEHSVNGVPQTDFTLTETSTDVYEGQFNSSVVIGDSVYYRIVATDASSGSNVTYDPATGYHGFEIIEALGLVLVIDDDTGAKTGDKPGVATTYKRGAAASQIASHLDYLGYVVDSTTVALTDPGTWSTYDFLVSTSGANQTPVADAGYRTDLENYVAGGGKLLIEGGELGYDAASYPGYPTFAENVLHVTGWDGDDSGDLGIVAGMETHPVATNPNAIPASMSVAYTGYGDQDASPPASDAYIVYECATDPGDAGILVYDDNPNPASAQIVFYSFNFAALADQATRNDLLENTATFLLANESAPTGAISGVCDLTDTGDDSGVELVLSGTGSGTTYSATDGNYSFTGLYAGTYSVTASKDGYYPYSTTISDIVVGTEEVPGIDFVFMPLALGTVSGTVALDDSPGDATGVIVEITGQTASDTTAADGVYALAGVYPGDITVVARKDGYQNASVDTFMPNGGALTGIDMTLYPGVNEVCYDFEADDGGFAPTPTSGGWAWGIPTAFDGPAAAYSGVNVWGTDLAADYANSASWTLDMPAIDLSGFSGAVLEYYQWYSIESYYDGGNVKISTDGGSTWTIITPDGGYPEDAATTSNSGIPGEPCFSGSTVGNFWHLVQFDLSAYVGQEIIIRFHFGSDSSVPYPGWFIDDVCIKEGIVMQVPENLVATSGLENHVPLDWDDVGTGKWTNYLAAPPSRENALAFEKWTMIPQDQRDHHAQLNKQFEGYNIFRAETPGGPYSKLNVDPLHDSDYDDTDVINGTDYYYVVNADYGSYGQSSFSNEAYGRPENNAPAVPENLTGYNIDYDVFLNWDDNTDYDLAGYKVYRSYNYGDFDSVATTDAMTSEYSETVSGDGVWRYKVTAFDDKTPPAESGFSNTATVPIGLLPPENLVAEDGYDGHVPLHWNPPGTGAPELSILLVSDQTDDAVTPEYYDQIYTDAFDEYGISYTVWDHDTQGEPTLSDLAPYSVIFWITGVSGGTAASGDPGGHVTLTLSEEATLVDWLDLGGKNLVLSGFWIAWNCVADAGTQTQYASTLFDDYIKLSYPVENFSGWITVDNTWTLDGQGGPIGGTDIWPVNWVSAENYPDQLESTEAGSIIYMWNDGALTHYGGGIKYDGGTFKTVLLAAPVEQVGDTDDKNLLVARILDWFSGAAKSLDYAGEISKSVPSTSATGIGVGKESRATGKSNGIDLRVEPGHYEVASKDAVFQYHVYRSLTSPVPFIRENIIASVPGSQTDYDDWGPGGLGLDNGTTYYYVVQADYGAAGQSWQSNEDDGTPVNAPPAAPLNLVGVLVDDTVQLDWDDNTEYDFDYYNVYRKRGSDPFAFLDTSPVSNYDDVLVLDGMYTYYVTAVDADAAESDPSNNTETFIYGLLPPTDLVAHDGYDGRVPINWFPPGQMPEYELAYDNGTAEDALALNVAGNGGGVRFTPLGYPAQIGKARIYIYDYSNPLQQFTVNVYDDDGAVAGGTILATANAQASAGNEWVEVDFSGEGITITEGDFYVGVIWQVGADPGPTQYVGWDTDDTYEDRSWLIIDGGATWDQSELHTYLPGEEWMMRATVYGPSKKAILAGMENEVETYEISYHDKPIDVQNTASLSMAHMPDGPSSTIIPHDYVTILSEGDVDKQPTGYNLYRSLSPGVTPDPGNLLVSLPDTLAYTDYAVVNGTPYYYIATAVYPGPEESDPSNEDEGIPNDFMPPAAITDLAGTSPDGIQVDLTWTDPTTNQDGSPLDDLTLIHIYRGGVEVGTANPGDESYTDTPGVTGYVEYYVTSTDEVPNESDPSNVINVLVGLPGYQEDFEDGDGDYVADPLTGGWEWGPPNTGPTNPHSGSYLWATRLAGDYGTSSDYKLTTIELVAYEDASMDFWHWFDTEAYYDGGNVKISTDGGTSWTIIDPDVAYPEDAASTGNAGIPGERCYSGHIQGFWEQVFFDLSAYGTTEGQDIMIRFHFGSDGSVQYPGWYVDDVVLWNAGLPTSVDGSDIVSVPDKFEVFQNYPNPFNPKTMIKYALPSECNVEVAVFNATGQKVRTLFSGRQSAGYKSLTWDGDDDAGRAVASGIYFYKVTADEKSHVSKMILMK